MAKKLCIAATRIKQPDKQTRRYRRVIGQRLKTANAKLTALVARFDVYTDLADGAAPTTETLTEDLAVLLELQATVKGLNRALGFSDVND